MGCFNADLDTRHGEGQALALRYDEERRGTGFPTPYDMTRKGEGQALALRYTGKGEGQGFQPPYDTTRKNAI